jgi:hypothetical protein
MPAPRAFDDEIPRLVHPGDPFCTKLLEGGRAQIRGHQEAINDTKLLGEPPEPYQRLVHFSRRSQGNEEDGEPMAVMPPSEVNRA